MGLEFYEKRIVEEKIDSEIQRFERGIYSILEDDVDSDFMDWHEDVERDIENSTMMLCGILIGIIKGIRTSHGDNKIERDDIEDIAKIVSKKEDELQERLAR